VSQLTPEHEAELQPYDPYDRGPIRHEPRFRILRKLAAPFIALALLIWKAKFIFVAIFKLKIFTTSASMLVSIAAYALLFTWKFAVGLVLLLLVHELGHYVEARRQGLNVSAPMFIPFLGAAILLRDNPVNAWREALVAFAGPIVGSLGAAVVWFVGEQQNSELLIALGFFGFFINLFNLLPVTPLDGGRIVGAIHPIIWFLGFAALVGLVFLAPNPILILIAVIAGLDLWQRWERRKDPESRRYYEVAPWQRAVITVTYFALAGLLALAMDASFVERDL
jgi:Zn-dependent protease